MFFFFYLFCATFYITQINAEEINKTQHHPISFTDFLRNNNIPLRPDGKINIPAHIKHVKLDIGLSYNAPMSQYWLSHEDDLMVFGFEPNPSSVASILNGAVKQHPNHGEPLEKKYIENSFFLIPCALGLSSTSTIRFFLTKDDCGCSSIYFPKYFSVNQIIDVPIFSLSDFFDIFPFDTHPIIDYIKIDTQGSDLNIVKSAKQYLVERVVYITLEAENLQYLNTNNSYEAIDSYMRGLGFIPHATPYTADPTYFNPRFIDYVNTHNIKIYQRG